MVVGVDAGGTRTRAVLAASDGTVVGRGEAGGANLRSSGTDVEAPLTTALRAAVAACEPARVAGGVIGVAGAGTAGRRRAVAAACGAWCAAGLRGAPEVVDDVVVAFAAGTKAARGLVLAAGTGAIAAAVDGTAVLRRADGYGWILGDRGSAVWLGLEALRAVLGACDGRGPATELIEAVRDWLPAEPGLDALDDLGQAVVVAVHAGPAAAVGALAPAVTAAADRGDPVAGTIVDQACDSLLATLEAVAVTCPPGPLVLAGGLLDPRGPIGRRVAQAVTDRWPDATITRAGSGELGAVRLALSALPN